MRIGEWDEEGLTPSFGHEGDWLLEVLVTLGALEIAAYCLDVPHGRRMLVATDLGLLDAVSGDEGQATEVRARLVRWQDVRSPELLAVIGIDASARHAIRYELRVEEPRIEVVHAFADRRSDDRAIVAFARELVLRAGEPSPLPISEPDD